MTEPGGGPASGSLHTAPKQAREIIRRFLSEQEEEAWHGLLTEPKFTGPLLEGVITSAGWSAVCLVAAFLIMRRRDITGG